MDVAESCEAIESQVQDTIYANTYTMYTGCIKKSS